MIRFHCGWPKTGTKTLQAQLFEQRDALAAAGVIYPDRWRRQLLPEVPDGSHNGFVDVLDAIEEDGAPVEDFIAFLADNADRDVLISSELIALWALRPESRDVADRFFAAVRGVMPIRFVWTLREFDDFVCSLYLQLISMGRRLPPPEEFVGRVGPDNLFAGMRRFEECADSVAYVRYRRDGRHNLELLRELELPSTVSVEIERAVVGPRLNPSLTHKQAVALLEADALSTRSGVALDPRVLRRMFNAGEFRFEDDGPCVLIGEETRRRLREEALRCAIDLGPGAYVRFFNPREAEQPPAGVSDVDARVLSDADLNSLVWAYGRQSPHVAVPSGDPSSVFPPGGSGTTIGCTGRG